MPLRVTNHPLIVHKLTKLRDEKTKPKQFRDLVRELAVLLAYEASQDCELEEKVVRTPVGECVGKAFKHTGRLGAVFIEWSED
jgi:uracil phosphoribosyltransferase